MKIRIRGAGKKESFFIKLVSFSKIHQHRGAIQDPSIDLSLAGDIGHLDSISCPAFFFHFAHAGNLEMGILHHQDHPIPFFDQGRNLHHGFSQDLLGVDRQGYPFS
jgi:hypothetical protein